MDTNARAFMEREVDMAMAGWPEYQVPGDEDTEPQNPVLESFPHQQELKQYLVEQGYIEFGNQVFMRSKKGGRSKVFNTLKFRGNLAWCCDPECDKVIVDMPISLFGSQGEIAQHQNCFQQNLTVGYYELSLLPR